MFVTRIDPGDFARIMALPRSARMDLLEYLGSTPVPPSETGDLLRSVAIEGDLKPVAARRTAI